jgi:glutathione S-transferase
MKLYVDRGGRAPSPRRVRIFLAEKGIAVPRVELELHEENRSEEFRKKNPFRALPVLELDDGTCISESIAICRYFEEQKPEPPLFGTGPRERASIEMWTRRVELHLYLPIDFSGDFLGEHAAGIFRDGAHRMMRFLDRELAARPFIAGERFTIADVFALSALDFGIAHLGYAIPEAQPNLARWHREVSARPSARE